MKFRTLAEIPTTTKRALVRLDLNVPVSGSEIADTTRIERIKPTIDMLLAQDIQIFMCSHFGRPNGKNHKEYSLKQILPALEEILGEEVAFIEDIGSPFRDVSTKLILLENTRFYNGEVANDPIFAKLLASYGDIYVNDAFSASHRTHASICAITEFLPAYAGLALQQELAALTSGLTMPERPLTAIVGGAKISTKIDLLYNLVEKVDNLIVGGGMANSFLAAQDIEIGKSICEFEALDKAKNILQKAKESDCKIILPVDMVVVQKFAAHADNRVATAVDMAKNDIIVDIGPQSVDIIIETIASSATVIWNGPLGAFELAPFDKSTCLVAKAIAKHTQNGGLVSIAGGGDTICAIAMAGVSNKFTYISTAGGAFLEWMEGKTLPGIIKLMK